MDKKPVSGCMELMPKEQMWFDVLKEKIATSYRFCGYMPTETPALESMEVLLGKSGGETEKQIMAVGKRLGLRFDQTVPLARYIANNQNKLVFPFRRYQIGRVYRGERAQAGRYREFYQADVDIVSNKIVGVLEVADVISAIYFALKSIFAPKFTFRVNSRKILDGLCDYLKIEDRCTFMRELDKGCLSVGESQKLLEDFRRNPYSMFGEINDKVDDGLSELRDLKEFLCTYGVALDEVQIDISIARGLDYYTGIVFETFMNEASEYGSIASGGMYGNLIGMYAKNNFTGIGGSIGLTRLFSYMMKNCTEVFDGKSTFLVIPMANTMNEAVWVTRKLRESGEPAYLYTEDRKFRSKMEYANKIGVDKVVFVGDGEVSAKFITIKDMKSGAQTKVYWKCLGW